LTHGNRFSIMCLHRLRRERTDLAWSCFDTNNCPFKAVNSRSRSLGATSHQSNTSLSSLKPFSLELARLANLCCVTRPMLQYTVCAVELLQLSVYKDLSTTLSHHFPHNQPSILLEYHHDLPSSAAFRSHASSSFVSSIPSDVHSVCAPDGPR
jgi:hypothetical protein